MYDILDDTGLPYLRPDEDPEEFAVIAEELRLRYQPDDPEMQALVDCFAHTAWRRVRYLRDHAGITAHPETPNRAEALAWLAQLIDSLEKIGHWQHMALEFWPKFHIIDASETTDCETTYEQMASFRQKYREAQSRRALTPPAADAKPN